MFSTRRSRVAPAFPVMFRVITIFRSRTPWGTCGFNAKWELTRVGESAERQPAQLIQHAFFCLDVSSDLGGNALMSLLPKSRGQMATQEDHQARLPQERGEAGFLGSGMFGCASVFIRKGIEANILGEDSYYRNLFMFSQHKRQSQKIASEQHGGRRQKNQIR